MVSLGSVLAARKVYNIFCALLMLKVHAAHHQLSGLHHLHGLLYPLPWPIASRIASKMLQMPCELQDVLSPLKLGMFGAAGQYLNIVQGSYLLSMTSRPQSWSLAIADAVWDAAMKDAKTPTSMACQDYYNLLQRKVPHERERIRQVCATYACLRSTGTKTES